MKITPMQPVHIIDWEKVDFVKITLEKPYKNGGLRWRSGTSNPKRNLGFNASDPTTGKPYHPGVPIMYPEDAPAIAGDAERESFLMPIQAANDNFGHFHAPLETAGNGIIGFTITEERTRVAARWHWFKMPPGDGTMHPPMNRIAAPDVPQVAIRPLTKTMQPMKINGEEVVIRPREFFDFDAPNQYEQWDGKAAGANADVAMALQGFTQDEIDVIRDIVKARVANGKQKA